MSELLKKQKFGVEVEFTGITRTMAAEAVAEILGSHAAGPDRTCYRTYTIRDSKRRIWKVMRDSSICPVRKAGRELMDEYRVEFVTPPLNYEDIETLQTIIRKFKELGGFNMQQIIKLNPMYWYITGFRRTLMWGIPLDFNMLAVCGVCALLSMLVGVQMFRKTQDRFVLHI